MTNSEQDRLEARIRHRARQIWQEHGCPDGRDDDFLEMAREQIAIKDNQMLATQPNPLRDEKPRDPITKEPIEPLLAVTNQGEFPTLTDQGEEQTYPTLPDPAATSVDPRGANAR